MWWNRRQRGNLTASLGVLRAEYYALADADRQRNHQAAKEIEQILAKLQSKPGGEPPPITRDDLRSVSRLLVELIPREQLIPRAHQLRDAIRELLDNAALPAWFDRQIDEMTNAKEEDQRAIVRELQRRRAAVTIDFQTAELFRSAVLRNSLAVTMISMVACAAVIGFLAWGCSYELALFPLAAFFGVFGAWMSVASRIRDAEPRGLARHAELNEAPTSSVWLAPLFGALGAVLIVGGIKTKLLGGELVPSFDTLAPQECVSGDSATVISGLTAFTSQGIVFVLALVSLAAGWTERLVPDLLEWVGKRVGPP